MMLPSPRPEAHHPNLSLIGSSHPSDLLVGPSSSRFARASSTCKYDLLPEQGTTVGAEQPLLRISNAESEIMDGEESIEDLELHDNEDNNNGPRSNKTRTCPFCEAPFTTSSLGRHLDLYIKPKNPKAPDGVHDVDEIRKIRHGITRRQPKMAIKTGAQSDSAGWRSSSKSLTPTTLKHQQSNSVPKNETNSHTIGASPANTPATLRHDESLETGINAPNWQVTGVMNSLPPRGSSRSNVGTPSGQAQRMQEMRQDAGGKRISRTEPDHEALLRLQEAAEIGKASELALREVLGSLEAAKQKLQPFQLFDDVDYFSLCFPGLCLALLPEPSTLYGPIPFASSESWSLSPPGQQQFEAINQVLSMKIAAYEQKSGEMLDSRWFKHPAHVQNGYEQWTRLPESERVKAWNLELSRAFAGAKKQTADLKAKLEASQHRVRHLETEYDRLSRCQLPREFLLHPPSTLPVSASTVRQMDTSHFQSGVVEAGYDADALLSKWRATIRATARAKAPPTEISRQPSTSVSHSHVTGYAATFEGDYIFNGAQSGVNAPSMPGADHVHYATPPQPGTIIADDDHSNGMDDKNGENLGSYITRATELGKVGGPGAVMNRNGKRPHPPFAVSLPEAVHKPRRM